MILQSDKNNSFKGAFQNSIAKARRFFTTQRGDVNFNQGFKFSEIKQHQPSHEVFHNQPQGGGEEPLNCPCQCHGENKNKQKRKIQLKKGNPLAFRGQFKTLQQSLVQTFRVSLINLVPEILTQSLKRPIYLCALITLIFIGYRPASSPYNYNVFLVPMMISIIIQIIKEYVVNFYRYKVDSNIHQNLQFKVLNRHSSVPNGGQLKHTIKKVDKSPTKPVDVKEDKEYELINFKNLEPGDILLIQKENFIPSDILILDSSERCFEINTQRIDGKSSLQSKEALRCTFEDPNSQVKGKFEEYKKQLNCSLEYFCHSCNANDIEGTLRLKVEPTGEKFTIRNVILAGTLLHRVEWVFGLILQAGNESTIYKNTDYKRAKSSFYRKTLFKFSLLVTSILVIISLICKLIYSERYNFANNSSILSYLSTNRWKNDSSILIDSRSFFSAMGVSIPLLLYGIIDILLIQQKIVLEQNNKKNIVRINNPEALPSLSTVSWAFFDKTGTIINNKLKLESIILDKDLYFLDKNSEFCKQVLAIENDNHNQEQVECLMQEKENPKVEEHEIKATSSFVEGENPQNDHNNNIQVTNFNIFSPQNSQNNSLVLFNSLNALNSKRDSKDEEEELILNLLNINLQNGNPALPKSQSNQFSSQQSFQYLNDQSLQKKSSTPTESVTGSMALINKMASNTQSGKTHKRRGSILEFNVPQNQQQQQKEKKKLESVFSRATSRFAPKEPSIIVQSSFEKDLFQGEQEQKLKTNESEIKFDKEMLSPQFLGQNQLKQLKSNGGLETRLITTTETPLFSELCLPLTMESKEDLLISPSFQKKISQQNINSEKNVHFNINPKFPNQNKQFLSIENDSPLKQNSSFKTIPSEINNVFRFQEVLNDNKLEQKDNQKTQNENEMKSFSFCNLNISSQKLEQNENSYSPSRKQLFLHLNGSNQSENSKKNQSTLEVQDFADDEKQSDSLEMSREERDLSLPQESINQENKNSLWKYDNSDNDLKKSNLNVSQERPKTNKIPVLKVRKLQFHSNVMTGSIASKKSQASHQENDSMTSYKLDKLNEIPIEEQDQIQENNDNKDCQKNEKEDCQKNGIENTIQIYQSNDKKSEVVKESQEFSQNQIAVMTKVSSMFVQNQKEQQDARKSFQNIETQNLSISSSVKTGLISFKKKFASAITKNLDKISHIGKSSIDSKDPLPATNQQIEEKKIESEVKQDLLEYQAMEDMQKIFFHEGDRELQQKLIQYSEKTQDFVKSLIICQGWKIKIDKDKFMQLESKKREDEYIYKYLQDLGIKCELRKKRDQSYIITNSKAKQSIPIKVVIKNIIDFSTYRKGFRISYLVEESLTSKKEALGKRESEENLLLSMKKKSSTRLNQVRGSLNHQNSNLSIEVNSAPNYALYVKGETDLLDSCKSLNEPLKEKLKFCITRQFELGARAVVYGKKVLSKSQSDEMQQVIKSMKTTLEEFDGLYEKMLEELESGLEFLGIIFIQDTINEGFTETLHFLNECMIKVGILSGDSQSKVLSVVNQSSFSAPQYGLPSKTFEIEGITPEEIQISIKKSLSYLKDLIGERSKTSRPSQQILQIDSLSQVPFKFSYDRQVYQNVLVVGQKQIDVISANASLEAHFAFIMAHVGKIIGYELRAEHKQYFVRLVKFIEEKSTVMAVGDGWNDALMMQISDVSFEYQPDSQDSSLKYKKQAEKGRIKENGIFSLYSNNISNKEFKNNGELAKDSKDLEHNKRESINNSMSSPSNVPPTQNKQIFSVEKKKDLFNRTFSSPNAGDIVIKDLKTIKLLMKYYSPQILQQLQLLIYETFYFYFLLFLFNLAINWEHFSSNLLFFDSDIIFLTLFIYLPRCFFYLFYYDPLKNTHHPPLILLFDKMYLSNLQQRLGWRVSAVLLNSFIESIIHFLIIFFTSKNSSSNDSYQIFRFYIIFQIIMITKIKMFMNISSRIPIIFTIIFYFYEGLATFIYIGIFQNSSDFLEKHPIGPALFTGDNIMVLIFNFIVSIIFSVFYAIAKRYIGDRLTRQMMKHVEQTKFNSLPLENTPKILLPIEASSEFHEQGKYNIIVTQNCFEKLTLVEQFLDTYIIRLQKPYYLIKRIFKRVKIDKHIEQILNPAEFAFNQDLGFDPYTLQFFDNGLQKIYDQQKYKGQVWIYRLFLILGSFPGLVASIIAYSLNVHLRGEESYSDQNQSFKIMCIVLTLAYLIFSFVFFIDHFHKVIQLILFMLVTITIFFQLIAGWKNKIDFSGIAPLISYYFSIYPSQFIPFAILSFINLAQQYIWLSVHVSTDIIFTSEFYDSQQQNTFSIFIYLGYLSLIIVSYIVSTATKYFNSRDSKNKFLLAIQFQEEKTQRQDILSILLPEFIREDVILGKSNFSRDQEEGTIMFCDVSEFDKIMDCEGVNIVSLLDNLFREFDELTLIFGLQKIETVGKTYMAAGGLNAVERNLNKKIISSPSYIRMLLMAQKMHGVAARVQWGNGQMVKLKIGVHIGPITAGVIGYHKPQFSLIGDTVNTTSRLCSNCEPMKSLFSDVIFDKISPILEAGTEQTVADTDWNYEIFQFEAKGKGILTAYYISDQGENDYSPLVLSKVPTLKSEFHKRHKAREKKNDRNKTKVFNLPALLQDSKDIMDDTIQSSSQAIKSNIIEQSMEESKPSLESSHSFLQSELLSKASKLSHSQRGVTKVDFSQIKGSSIQQLDSKSQKIESLLLGMENNKQKKKGIMSLPECQQGNEISQIQRPQSNNELASVNQDKDKANKVFGRTQTLQHLRIKHIDPKLLGMADPNITGTNHEGSPSEGKLDKMRESPEETNSSMANDEVEVEIIKYSSFSLRIHKESQQLFQDFEQEYYSQHSLEFFSQISVFTVMNFIILMFNIILQKSRLVWIFNIIEIVALLSFSSCVIFFEKLSRYEYLSQFTTLSFLLMGISLMGNYFLNNDRIYKLIDILQIQALAILAILNMCHQTTYSLLYSLALLITFIIRDTLYHNFELSDFLLLLIPIVGFLFHKRHSYHRNLESFNLNRLHEHQRNQEIRLLVHLLPSHVIEIYQTFLRNPEDNSIFTEKFTQTTLLFADISGFTAYSSNKKPEEVVLMLKSLFTKFDHKCIKHNVFKLYTIGDCYIVMGFSDANKRDPPTEAKNVVEMGFSMIESLRQFRKEQKDHSEQSADIEMRIGIHVGEIIGGVIGKSVVRYDIYGKDVLLANKMESNGERGRILISEPLKIMLNQNFPDLLDYIPGPQVQVKSINIEMNSFFVAQKQE